MINDNRECLTKNSQITLRSCSENGGDKVFFIEDEISRGSSAICYNAYFFDEDNNKVSGSLKEFYPYDFGNMAFDLSRYKSVGDAHKNQLYSYKGTLDNFLRFKRGYIKPYQILSSIRGKTSEFPEAKDLNSYIPSYELYQGISPDSDNSENCTVYVWVRNEQGFITYNQVLKNICLSMAGDDYNSVKNLSFLLRCIFELAKAVDTLHLFSLYHLDLKPENFGIATYRDKPKDNIGISLYDLNSLYSGRARDDIVLSAGTKYFRSREVANRNTNRFSPASDIYSLGSLLYYSLVVDSKENEDTGVPEYFNVHFCEGKDEFDKNEYDSIGVKLRNSLFITDSDETQSSILFRKLCVILQKSLNIDCYHNDNGYYATADEFANDVREVIDILKIVEGPVAIDANTNYLAETFLFKKEDRLASKNKNGATGVIQWLLFQYPLYEYCTQKINEEDGCNVLVLGGGTYASKFIDLAFELSQVRNCRLDINVVSDNAKSDKETYLTTRPGMADFFEIDGVAANRKELVASPYGKLSFSDVKFQTENTYSLENSIKSICETRKYTYVFIALGNERLNEKAARLCAKNLGTSDDPGLVSYTVFDEKRKTTCISDPEAYGENITLLQLSVFDSLDKHKEYEMLRRMAFNVHLTWSPDYVNDIPAAKARFKSKYNFNSSLENALSLKYKLHSIDSSLILDFANPLELAAKVKKIIEESEESSSKSYIRELTMYEHRRWIVEKITDSWQTLSDVSRLHDDTKDRLNRLHPCIVPSEEACVLSQKMWSKPYNKWDDATEEEKETLDGLDRMSIEMHQHFLRESQKLRDNQKELDGQKNLAAELASCNTFALGVWNDLNHSIDVLVNDGTHITGATDRYKYYKKLLFSAQLDDEVRQKLSLVIKKIDKIIFPVLQASLHRNWKMVDEDLIRNIPFILTYSTAFHLCVPFFSEANGDYDTTSLFGNVASALMVNPLHLTFIADGEIVLKDMEGFKRSLEYCTKTLKNHRLQTDINVLVLRKNTDTFSPEDKMALSNVSDKIRFVDEIVYTGWNQVRALCDYLSQNSTKFTAIETNKTRISGLLQSANEFAAGSLENFDAEKAEGLFPMYSFDSKERRFVTTDRCSFLTYVHNSPNLLTSDLFYSRGKTIAFSEPELINEHEFLWKLYTGNSFYPEERKKCTLAWKALCGAIKEHQASSNQIAKFLAFCRNPEKTGRYVTYFPSFCQDAVEIIMKSLDGANFKYPFFEKNGYSISRIDSKSCKLTVKNIRNDVILELENLLVQPYCLVEKDMVEVVFAPEYIKVNAFSLRIENMSLPEKHIEQCCVILDQLREKRFIRSYKKDGNIVSFTFATEHYMHLLKNEGNILELHVYREIISSGLFNDVKNGVTVFWNGHTPSNEMDIVMVNGFKTFIIECKSVYELKREFYDKFYLLTKMFGINNVPIIVADLNNRISPTNALQIQQGEELGIKTITKAEDPIREMKGSNLI